MKFLQGERKFNSAQHDDKGCVLTVSSKIIQSKPRSIMFVYVLNLKLNLI